MFLIVGKVLEVLQPIPLKNALDELSVPGRTFPAKWILVYAAVRVTSKLLIEGKDVLFAGVSAEMER